MTRNRTRRDKNEIEKKEKYHAERISPKAYVYRYRDTCYRDI